MKAPNYSILLVFKMQYHYWMARSFTMQYSKRFYKHRMAYIYLSGAEWSRSLKTKKKAPLTRLLEELDKEKPSQR